MPRSVEEIEAAMAQAKADGEPPMGKVLRALREELKAAQNPADAAGAAGPDEPAPFDASASDTVVAKILPQVYGDRPLAPEPPQRGFCSEQEFIDDTLSKIAASIEFKGGTLNNIVEKIYERLDAVLKARRVVVEIVQDLGEGATWPQWMALNRNGSTGAKLPPRPEPAPRVVPVAPSVTEGGMPVRSARPSSAEILSTVAGGDPRAAVRQDLSVRAAAARPEPAPVL